MGGHPGKEKVEGELKKSSGLPSPPSRFPFPLFTVVRTVGEEEGLTSVFKGKARSHGRGRRGRTTFQNQKRTELSEKKEEEEEVEEKEGKCGGVEAGERKGDTVERPQETREKEEWGFSVLHLLAREKGIFHFLALNTKSKSNHVRFGLVYCRRCRLQFTIQEKTGSAILFHSLPHIDFAAAIFMNIAMNMN